MLVCNGKLHSVLILWLLKDQGFRAIGTFTNVLV